MKKDCAFIRRFTVMIILKNKLMYLVCYGKIRNFYVIFRKINLKLVKKKVMLRLKGKTK